MFQEILEAQDNRPDESRHLYVLLVSRLENECILQVYQAHGLTRPTSLLQSTLRPNHKFDIEVIASQWIAHRVGPSLCCYEHSFHR